LARRRSVRVALAVIAAAGLASVGYAVWSRNGSARTEVPLVAVQRGPLVISVSQSGTIQNRERAVVKSEVEGTASILYLIPEGKQVQKDDLLLELDSSRLQDARNQQQIVVMNAEAAYIHARENLAVVKSQADSDVAKADLDYKFAQQDLEKYQAGDYPQELRKAKADIQIAEEELQRAKDKLDWSQRLAAEGYIMQTELQADELAASRAKIDLDLAKSAMDLLERYTHQRNLDQLNSNLEQAKEALSRTKRKAAADVVQADADLKAKKSEYERQQAQLKKSDEQIAKCHITAPVAGMVVYASTGQAARHRRIEPLEEGQQVRERQELIYLPTNTAMMAEIKIHEASLRKVQQGMPVWVTVDALPGTVFGGRVDKIGLLPDAQSAWMNPDLKVYDAEIGIEGDASVLRAGMTCRAEIIVEQYADALFVPMQSVVRVGGQTVVYVPGPEGPQARPVEVGLDNNRMIRIVKGLEAGEQVLLAPPLAPSTVSEGPAEAGPAPAAVLPVSTTAPAREAAAAAPVRPTTRPAIDFRRLREMTPEERRRFLESLSPEERERMQERRGPREGGGSAGRRREQG